jgi:hypothetical protein
VLSGRGLFVGPIPRPDESYLGWCVLSMISKPEPLGGLGPLGVSSHDKQKTYVSSDVNRFFCFCYLLMHRYDMFA